MQATVTNQSSLALKSLPMPLLWVLAIILTATLFIIDVQQGPIDIALFDAIAHGVSGEHSEQSVHSIQWLILTEIRLPRAFLAVLVGFVLGCAGASLQGLLRNPLAGPGLVGVTNCSALGAVCTLYFGMAGLSWFALPLGGIIGAFASVVLIFLLAGRQGSVLNLILAGVAINAVASSFIALALNFSDNPYAMNEIVYWLLGSLNNRSLNDVAIVAPFMFVGLAIMMTRGAYLDALSLGEETAQSLGFSPNKERALIVIGVAMAVGAAVSISGNIGFIGLVVPHLLRPLVGHQPGKLLALSGIGGSLLLLLADICVQLISVNQELKLGVVTALVGGPFFLWLIYRMRNEVV